GSGDRGLLRECRSRPRFTLTLTRAATPLHLPAMPTRPKPKKKPTTFDTFFRAIQEDLLVIRKDMATKEEIRAIRGEMATKTDLAKLATRENCAKFAKM